MQSFTRRLKDESVLVYTWFEAMHTRIDMMMWMPGNEEKTMLDAAGRIESEVIRLEESGSRFISASELSRLNSMPFGADMPLSEEMFHILQDCIEYNEQTCGLFDIAVSQDFPGIMLRDKICLDAAELTAVRLYDWVKLDLSGYLKGYALDRAVCLAADAGLKNILFSFGNSSVAARGNHPGGRGWPVETLSGEKFILYDECLTTSGNSSDQRKHIVNPLTGKMIEGEGMISVVTPTAEEGEVMSIAAFLRNHIVDGQL